MWMRIFDVTEDRRFMKILPVYVAPAQHVTFFINLCDADGIEECAARGTRPRTRSWRG